MHPKNPVSDEFEEALGVVSDEYIRRLNILMEGYRIDSSAPHAGSFLAVSLALDFVAGFDVVNGAGRGRPPSVHKHADLADAIERVMEEKGVGISVACKTPPSTIRVRSARSPPARSWT